MSAFDPKLLEATEITEANVTRNDPVPESVYPAVCDSFEVRKVETKKGAQAILRLGWMILDDTLKEKMNRDKVVSNQDIWLDLTPNGTLATGPNVNAQLGRTREACGLNQPGKRFAFAMFVGKGPMNVTVSHRTDEKTGDVFDSVSQVRKPE